MYLMYLHRGLRCTPIPVWRALFTLFFCEDCRYGVRVYSTRMREVFLFFVFVLFRPCGVVQRNPYTRSKYAIKANKYQVAVQLN